MTTVQMRNVRASLASFVTEHLPVPDPHSDVMIDRAWQIADRLESRLINELEKVEAEGGGDAD